MNSANFSGLISLGVLFGSGRPADQDGVVDGVWSDMTEIVAWDTSPSYALGFGIGQQNSKRDHMISTYCQPKINFLY